MEVLLEKGALIEAMTKDKGTSLHLAAQDGHSGTVELLLEKGAWIEAINGIYKRYSVAFCSTEWSFRYSETSC